MKTQKDHKTILVEYCGSLSDNDLRFLGTRLTERFSGDLGDALNYLSQKPQIDNILGSANTPDELYQLCEVVADLILKEAKKRKVNLWGIDKKDKEEKPDRKPYEKKPYEKKTYESDRKPYEKKSYESDRRPSFR